MNEHHSANRTPDRKLRTQKQTKKRPNLKWQANFKGIDKSIARIIDADNAEKHAQPNNKIVPSSFLLGHGVAHNFQMEITRPDEAQHGAGKIANETHQNLKMWYKTGHHDGAHNDSYTKAIAPDFQFAVQFVDGGEACFRWSTEKCPFQ